MHSVSASKPLIRLAYVPIQKLHQGPDGSALLAREQASGQLVELRQAMVAHSDEARWAEIDRAAKIYALLDHEGFRRLLARETSGGTPLLVFESRREPDLASELARAALSEPRIWSLVWRLAHSLAAAHKLGYVHGRLGPSQVWLRDDTAPLLDFARLDVGPGPGELDRACASPEARAGEPLDTASDVYSLGMLVKIAALGRVPRASDAAAFGVLDLLVQSLTALEREARPTLIEVCDELEQLGVAPQQSVAMQATLLSRPPGEGGLSPARPAGLTLGERPLISAPAPGPAAPRQLAAGMRLGRYELLHKLGEGGMGEVYRALDRTDGRHVALKVLRSESHADAGKRRRFRKEARILSELDSDYVARLIEMNRDGDTDYIALEFVDGGDLAKLLAEHAGRLPEREALAIVADVCRGLGEAHARGIVHRDIKPQNVMLTRAPDGSNAVRGQIKLCDFGIARALHGRSGTLAYTQADTLLGTPDFMAPEQCNGQELSPATDVYALGVMLFKMLSGSYPFSANETVAILVAHISQAPPDLAQVCPDVSAPAAALVARMLAKAPSDRFADASVLLEEIERLLNGEASAIDIHPIRPATPAERVVQHVFEWELSASPDALWPYLSNTDRLNRAVGLPPALFERLPGAAAPATFGKNRVAGISLRWQEHPFEWVEGRRWGVLRVFERGVMCWYTIELELHPKPDGGTRLRYVMTLEPRHFLGRWIVAIEMRLKQRAALGGIFARIDAFVGERGRRLPGSDAFEPPKPLSPAQRHALERGLSRLRDDGVAPQLVDALAAFCENAPEQEVAHLRPLAFARTYGLDPDRTVDACLRGAHHGLFVLLWEVLCPLCRVAAGFAESLRALADHGHCPACNSDFALDFAQSLELVLRVAPDIRSSELRTYCVGGPAFAPHVVAQIRLAAAARVRLDLALGVGSYKVRALQLSQAFPLQISHSAHGHRGRVQFDAAAAALHARELLGPSAQHLEIENQLGREIVVRVERSAPREDALTAARAACLASFRKLFPGEVLASGRLVAVGRPAFVVSAVHRQRQLMTELGDARAFEQILKHLQWIEEATVAEGGALVKTASAATLCAFDSASAAVRAAMALRARLDHAARSSGTSAPAGSGSASLAPARPLDIRIVAHQGPAVAATIDGRLDYFGHSVESALDLVAHAPAGCVLLSEVLAEDQNALADLSGAGHALEIIELGSHGGSCLLARARLDDPA